MTNGAKNIHKRIDNVTSQFLELSIGYSCGIRKDQAVLNSARIGEPAMLHAPDSHVATDIRRLVDLICASDSLHGNNGLNISLPTGKH